MRLVLLVAALACLVVGASASAELKLDYPGAYDDSAPAEKRGSGARVRAGGGQGGTAIHWMAFNGDEAGVSQAIISGAGVNERVKKGSTPLHLAAYNGHTAVARLLIEHGARVNARTEDGITPLDWAQRNGHEEVAMLLIAHGAKNNKADRVRTRGKDPVDQQTGSEEKPGRTAPDNRQLPLKYSLLPVLEESVLVINEPVKADGQPEKPVSGESYRIQLGAFGSKQRAMDAWKSHKKKYPGFLGSRQLILDTVSVKGKNFHRVQTGPMSRSDAWAICGRLKEANQACAVMKRGP